MTMSQILSYIGGTSQPVLTSQNNGPDFFDLIQSLQCGDTVISIFPSVIYLIGIALLIHHIITMNIRPQLYRRVGRELLLQIPWQEILIFMLIYQCIRIWLSTLVLLNTIFKYYQKQVVTGIAPFNKYTNVSDIRNLHPMVQAILAPRVLKIFVCSLMSVIPFLALFKLKERRPLPQFMLWMGPVRRDRSELGASGYYLERPISELTLSSADCEVTRSCSCGDVSILKLKSKRIRSRKSVSV
ncbi:hypothetical protein RUM44_008403 [Polyplax serrata]|uniref:Uncharacterized protein n=1 Tax=Polyplax serrata TaxID=468196 RepID=A0ABR1BC84_POLSC